MIEDPQGGADRTTAAGAGRSEDERQEGSASRPRHGYGSRAEPESAGAGPTVLRIRGPERTFVGPTLIGLNVAVFVLMIASGVSLSSPDPIDLLDFGANQGELVAAGEWSRLATSVFVHAGLIHLAFNMMALRSLSIVERLHGNGAFLAVYLLSGLGGSIASVLSRPHGVSVGASGAIMGLIGALLAFFLLHRRSMPRELFRKMIGNLLLVLVINAVFGIVVPSIDNAAHAGGLVTGFVAGVALDRAPDASPRLGRGRLVRALAMLFVLACLALAIRWRV